MNFFVTILGSGAATPTLGRHCSAQVVSINGFRMLVDCGEATQSQMRAFRQKMQAFSTIFISHLHGDHLFGLPGLLSSMHLCGRTEPVTVYAPKGIKAALELLFEVSGTHLTYELTFVEMDFDTPTLIFENEKCKVTAFPLFHSVPTYGFLFEEQQPRPNIRHDMRTMLQLTPLECREIKMGADYITADGELIPNSELVHPARRPLRYAYCCDTAYDESLIPIVKDVDLLCMESTFDRTRVDLAGDKRHCTTVQAAELAQKADVGQLMLTHFSARYKIATMLIEEAQSVFPNTFAAEDGLMVQVREKE